MEIWINKYPLDRFCSHYSASYKSGSHIDLAFSFRLVLSSIRTVSYLPAGISDHSPIEIMVQVGGGRSGLLEPIL